MAKVLRIGQGLELPAAEACTTTIGILAKRGAGKTYTALRLVEEMLEAALPVCIVDPVGVCWGLRASADGRGRGYPVIVFGGGHGDLPLEQGAGEMVADFVVDERRPCVLDLFRKAKASTRRTFDSSATPKPGEARVEPKRLAEVDLEGLRGRMADLAERAKDRDPRQLKARTEALVRRVAQLEAEIARARAAAAAARPAAGADARFKRQMARAEALAERALGRIEALQKRIFEERDGLAKVAGELARGLAAARAVGTPGSMPSPVPAQRTAGPAVPRPAAVVRAAEDRAGGLRGLAGGERRILTVLAHNPSGASKAKVALTAGYAVGGGGFNNYLSALRSRGLLEGSGELRATPAGLEALGPVPPLPSGPELLEHWCHELGKAEGLILRALASHPRGAMVKDELATATGYAPDGGGFNNALSRLRTLELVSGRGELRLSETLREGV